MPTTPLATPQPPPTTTLHLTRTTLVAHLEGAYPDIDQRWLNRAIDSYNVKNNNYTPVVGDIVEKITECRWYPKVEKKRRGETHDAAVVRRRNEWLETLVESKAEWFAKQIGPCSPTFPHIRNITTYEGDCILVENCNHVYEITEKLLKTNYPKRLEIKALQPNEKFRSNDYIKGCRQRLCNAFPKHWKSTIKAVMAENNHDFQKSHAALSTMTANSWWTAVFSFVPRKPASSPSMFDLDLLRDVDALSQQKRDESTHRDLQLARTLNAAEYEETEQSITCLCCFGDYPFEDLCQCPNAHLFCKGCVTRVVEEGLFGQGRLRGQEVPCMSSEGCEATFSSRELERILPENVFRVWEDAVVENGVREAGLKVVKCAFCNYVEEAPRKTLLETYKQKLKLATLPHHLWSLTDTLLHNPIFPLSLATLTFFLLFPSSILISWLFSAFVAKFLDKCFTLASDRWRKPRPHVVPPAFNCGNPKCGRASCTVCGKEWEALHRCFEKEVDELRVCVEMAMSRSMIRTCPSCSISFSKLSGCNKMTCPRCGYIMCYICRKDIADEKYKHFCEHFRPIPGPCRTCQKCDLYYVADDRATRRAAGLKAKEEWVRRHPGREGVDVDVEAMA